MFRSLRQILAIAIPVSLLVLLAGVLLCFWNLWDQTVVVTLIPIWAWAGGATALSLISWALLKNPLHLVSAVLWLIAGIGLADETAGLIRGVGALFPWGDEASSEGDSQPLGRVRVATLSGAKPGDAFFSTLETLAPDLVLLPGYTEATAVSDLAERLYGTEAGTVRSDTCAIVGRGRLSIEEEDAATGSLVATFERAPGGEIFDVACLRLPAAMARTDFWRPDAWGELSERRRENRRLLRGIVAALPKRLGADYQIAGGDFGAPPSDDIFRLLRNARLADSHRLAGRGWGNTHPAYLPVLRTTQIWATAGFQPERSGTFPAGPTQGSHRGVYSDFLVVSPPGPPPPVTAPPTAEP